MRRQGNLSGILPAELQRRPQTLRRYQTCPDGIVLLPADEKPVWPQRQNGRAEGRFAGADSPGFGEYILVHDL